MRRKGVDIITMGCSKNLVDSERLMAQLRHAGYDVTHDSEEPDGEICVVNTCGFIGDAKEESIEMILQQGQRKAHGELKRLYVMGCLSERYLEELKGELPEVDGWYGKFDWKDLVTDLGHAWESSLSPRRTLTTPGHYAYVKISEGCNRRCSYCAIPLITGHHVSRPIDDILAEVRELADEGVHEFQIIAQELTYYGLDLYHRRALPELIERMAGIEGVEWIRLHYAYPTDFPWELADVMRRHENVCNYLDIALQHVSDSVLTAMRRRITKAETYAFVERLRREVPGICIRTTLMVGHPGETEEAFAELLEFVRWARFEHMGAFAYSEEDGTHSAEAFEDEIPEAVKQERLSRLMRLQQRIAGEIQEKLVGKTLKVIFDRVDGDYLIGRTEYDSPEVDNEVLVALKELPASPDEMIGGSYEVEIISSEYFDLYGRVKD
ncbi:MAG: 30S ribosomal protein S12 methylthiotransferase RimO [Bacteroidaceae bacterium]|nr:30S ribosomal protein S12 methylthiotransferase RimO [Bacteroidaceae bacterium]